MVYTDENGVIYDDEGKIIGAKPRTYKTPEGTWNFYPNAKGARRAQKAQPQQEARDPIQDFFFGG